MIRKFLKKISGLNVITGFVVILGTAGMSDLDLIDLKTILVRCGIGLLFCAIGVVGLTANNCKSSIKH